MAPGTQINQESVTTLFPGSSLYLEVGPGNEVEYMKDLGRFPFNKNYRFKFSEFSLVEWNASDRFPGFVVTCPATQGMLGDHLLCLKMADFLNIFAALE